MVLEELDGHLRTYHLYTVGEDGERYIAKEGGFSDSPGTRWYFTGYNRNPTTYVIYLYGWTYEEEQSGNYRIRVMTHDRGDLGRHPDAGVAVNDRLDLPLGQVVEGNLFASLTTGDRDFSDWFRIPNVRSGYTIRAQLLTVEEFGIGDPREILKLSQPDRVDLSIYRAGLNQRGEYEDMAIKWGEHYLPGRTAMATLEHTVEEAGDYYVVIQRQGTWNARYTVRVDVIAGPENEECNRLLEEYRQKRREYLEFAGAISFAQRFDEVNEAIQMVKEAMENTQEETKSFVEDVEKVDKLLNKVKLSNEKLKELLKGVSGGLESSSNLMEKANEALGKLDTAMGILEPLVHAQEASPSEALEQFANYFENVTEAIGPLVKAIPVLGAFLEIYVDGIKNCAQSAEQIEKIVQKYDRLYESFDLPEREHLYMHPKTPEETQLEKKREMEDELNTLAQKLLDECGIDVNTEEEPADTSIYGDIDRAADEARRQCTTPKRAYDDATILENSLRTQEPKQLVLCEYYKKAMTEIQPEFNELVKLREELESLNKEIESLRSVSYSSMTDEERRELDNKLFRRRNLTSYIISNQENEVTRSLLKLNFDSYEELKSAHDRALAALEETRGKLTEATAARIRAHDEWIQCRRAYLLEQARRNNWRQSDLNVDHGHLFR